MFFVGTGSHPKIWRLIFPILTHPGNGSAKARRTWFQGDPPTTQPPRYAPQKQSELIYATGVGGGPEVMSKTLNVFSIHPTPLFF